MLEKINKVKSDKVVKFVEDFLKHSFLLNTWISSDDFEQCCAACGFCDSFTCNEDFSYITRQFVLVCEKKGYEVHKVMRTIKVLDNTLLGHYFYIDTNPNCNIVK